MSIFRVITIVIYANAINGWVLTNVDFKEIEARVYGVDGKYKLDMYEDGDENNLKFALIYPGTKWCGAGNIADDYDDLGPSKEADSCCRDHDNCPDVMAAWETKNNLTNTAFYSRLHCDCDEKFVKCLRAADTSASRQIGVIYFDALNTKCYRNEYPIKECTKKGGWLKGKCLEYSYYTDRAKTNQWFDVPSF